MPVAVIGSASRFASAADADSNHYSGSRSASGVLV